MATTYLTVSFTKTTTIQSRSIGYTFRTWILEFRLLEYLYNTFLAMFVNIHLADYNRVVRINS